MNRSGAAEVAEVVDEIAPTPAAIGYRRLWQFAWPVATSTSTVTLLTLVNLFWIGHLGTIAVAAVSVCGNILFIVFGLSSIVHTGALAIVSRRVGEGHIGAAHAAVRHAVLLGGVLGLGVALAGWLAAPATVGFFGVGTDVEALAISYLRIMYIAQVPLFLSVALSACYQAGGDTRTPMLLNVGVVLANGLADPFSSSRRQVVAGPTSAGSLGRRRRRHCAVLTGL
jgi:Na+-driven multidrug efflux pump